MTEINHALTGAAIGLSTSEPALALPLAFLSHFALDSLPHFGVTWPSEVWVGSKRFKIYLAAEAILCIILVVVLAATHPKNWLVASLAAFLATSPDLFWLKRFLVVQKTARDIPNKSWFDRFHAAIQWYEKPPGAAVEAVWFVGAAVIIWWLL